MAGNKWNRIMSDISNKYPDLPKSFRVDLANGINVLPFDDIYTKRIKYKKTENGRFKIEINVAKRVILVMEQNDDDSTSEIKFKISRPKHLKICGTLDVRNTISKTLEIIEETSDVKLEDQELLDALEKIKIANSLAKTNPGNKGFLYAIKHKLLKYIAYNREDLVEYIRPLLNNSHKTLEIKLTTGHIFHVGYDRKERYNVDWPTNSAEIGIYTRDNSGYTLPADLNIPELEIDLFKLCLKLYKGHIRKVALDSVKYWWTVEIMKKKYNNPGLDIIPSGDDVDMNSKYSALRSTKTKYLIPGVHDKPEKFDYYFKEAIKSGINL